MSTNKIVIGCLVAFAIGLTFVIIAGWLFSRFTLKMAQSFSRENEPPPALKKTGVSIGSDFLSKKPFCYSYSMGMPSDIVQGKVDPRPQVAIAVASNGKGVFLNEDGEEQSQVYLWGESMDTDIVDVDRDGTCEFMARRSLGPWGAYVSNHHGKILWSYGGGLPGVDDMAMGDVDGDGKLEFAVGFNGGGGVHLLNSNGEKIWREPDGNVWHVEMTDVNGDGKDEIVHSNAEGQITVRHGSGGVISQAKPDAYFTDFSLIPWPTKTDRKLIMVVGEGALSILGFDGKVVKKLDAPGVTDRGKAKGVYARLTSESDYLAVLVQFYLWKRAVLCVYNPAKKLVYHEIIPEPSRAIAAFTKKGAKAESLLVGGEDWLWRYEAARTPANAPKKH